MFKLNVNLFSDGISMSAGPKPCLASVDLGDYDLGDWAMRMG